LWGVPGDEPLDRVRRALAARGVTPAFVDQRFGPIQSLSPDGTLTAHSGRRGSLALSHVRVAYLRPVASDVACTFGGADDPVRNKVAAHESALWAWADCTQAEVINRPAAMAANGSKPYQLALIRDAGFAVPETLVTTDPSAARAFCQRHGRVIYKSISGVRSVVRQLDRAELSRLDEVYACPTQLQRYIAGTDVRVHVVGDEIVATFVHSTADDYRYASRTGDAVSLGPFELPAEISAACRRMVRGMQLWFAGVDLRLTPDGAWVCFEVNPSPAFPYYDQYAPNVENALVELLLKLDEDA